VALPAGVARRIHGKGGQAGRHASKAVKEGAGNTGSRGQRGLATSTGIATAGLPHISAAASHTAPQPNSPTAASSHVPHTCTASSLSPVSRRLPHL
jgi:hypothetical protein